jgi:hypothetical protein
MYDEKEVFEMLASLVSRVKKIPGERGDYIMPPRSRVIAWP